MKATKIKQAGLDNANLLLEYMQSENFPIGEVKTFSITKARDNTGIDRKQIGVALERLEMAGRIKVFKMPVGSRKSPEIKLLNEEHISFADFTNGIEAYKGTPDGRGGRRISAEKANQILQALLVNTETVSTEEVSRDMRVGVGTVYKVARQPEFFGLELTESEREQLKKRFGEAKVVEPKPKPQPQTQADQVIGYGNVPIELFLNNSEFPIVAEANRAILKLWKKEKALEDERRKLHDKEAEVRSLKATLSSIQSRNLHTAGIVHGD